MLCVRGLSSLVTGLAFVPLQAVALVSRLAFVAQLTRCLVCQDRRYVARARRAATVSAISFFIPATS